MTSRFDSESEYLLELARDKSKESRAALANIIVELFENRQGSLSDRERALMYNILHGVVREIEMSVRQAVAKQLASLPDVPSDLLSLLANDEIDVAFPILTECGLLKDADLIDIIRMRTMEHQLAIAMRHSVSEEVSDALVQTDRESVVVRIRRGDEAQAVELKPVRADGKQVVFKLRRGVMFHDGTPFDANAVTFLLSASKGSRKFREPALRRGDVLQHTSHLSLPKSLGDENDEGAFSAPNSLTASVSQDSLSIGECHGLKSSVGLGHQLFLGRDRQGCDIVKFRPVDELLVGLRDISLVINKSDCSRVKFEIVQSLTD